MTERREPTDLGRNERRPHREYGYALVVFLLVFLAFRPGGSQIGDSRYYLLITQRLVETGHFHLDSVPGVSLNAHQASETGLLHQIGGHTYHFFPPGTPILTAPLFAVGKWFGASVLDEQGVYRLEREIRLHRRIAPLLMATLVALIFLTSRLFIGRAMSMLVALSAAFGTQIWSTASRGLWSHTWGVLLVGIAIHLLVRGEREGRSIHPVLLSSTLAWAFFCRPTFAVPWLAVAVYLAIGRRSDFLKYTVTACSWLAGFAAFSQFHFGTWLPAYYDLGQRMGPTHFVEALMGNLISPSRGLLIYTPLVWVVLFLIARFWKHLDGRPLVVLSLSIISCHWVLISTFPHWWGGWSYGSRLTTDLIPWFVLLGILGLRARDIAIKTSEAGAHSLLLRAAAPLLLLASVLINANGGLWSGAYQWNANPDVDSHPERLWDWSQPQFLHPFH
ncbi:hypothetical protein MK489_14215 [Myxococcota bacterium]|nr:hypothetical protein [Myxococcota bacterium]